MEVSFDKQGKVRVLEEEKYEQTKQLQEQTAAFSSSESTIGTPMMRISYETALVAKRYMQALAAEPSHLSPLPPPCTLRCFFMLFHHHEI